MQQKHDVQCENSQLASFVNLSLVSNHTYHTQQHPFAHMLTSRIRD